MGLSRDQAVREALRYTTWPHAYCAAFVQKVFGFGWVGASAIDAWNRAQHKHTNFPPPPGVPCYWGPKGHNPYGHIAVSLGGGKCRSSDYPGSGRVGTVDIRWIEQHWPNTGRYLGWSEDIAGHMIPGGGGAAPAHGEEEDMTKEEHIWLEDILRRVQSMHAGNYKTIGKEQAVPPSVGAGGTLTWLDHKLKPIIDRLAALERKVG